MSIKNFFIRGEKLKDGLAGIRYARYLINIKHPNHTSTKIVELHGYSEDWIESTIKQATEANLEKSIKGGRPTKRYGHSFVLSLPKGTKIPTDDQWKEILNAPLKVLAAKLKIPSKTLMSNCYIVAHNQSNPHIHLLVSSVIEGKTYNQQLSSERTSFAMKRAFTSKCEQTLGLSKLTYKPNIRLAKKLSKLKQEEKLVKQIHNYLGKWINATLEGNTKQFNRQINRIKKALDELNDINQEAVKTIEIQLEEKVPNIKKLLKGDKP